MYPHRAPLVHATEVDFQPTDMLYTQETRYPSPEHIFLVRCSLITKLVSTFSCMYMLIIVEIIDIVYFIHRETLQRGSRQGGGHERHLYPIWIR